MHPHLFIASCLNNFVLTNILEMAVKIHKSKKISINGQVLPRRSKSSAATKKTVKSSKSKKTVALRSTITPGTVLILLAGRFRGKRVVFLKQLSSGLLLVTGPYKINGVPLKRVNQAYVIATTTKVDISSLKLSSKLDDSFFQRAKKPWFKRHTLSQTEGEAAPVEAEKKAVTAEQKALQAEVDGQLCPLIKKTQLLTSYLRSFFTLKGGQAPHAMKF